MKLIITRHFEKRYQALPSEVQEQTDQKLKLLLKNPRHPSLRLKKIRGTKNIWEVSITMRYRLTLEIAQEGYLLRKIGEHDKTLKIP